MKILQIINSFATGGAEKLLLETLPSYREKGIEMDILLLNGNEYPFMTELIKLDCCTVFSLGSGSVYNPIHIFRIIPYLKKYDIVHVHLFPAQYWVVLAKIISFSKVKLLFTEHNTSNRRMNNRWFQFCDKIIYSFFDNVVCISLEVKQVLERHLANNNGLKVINNGVNLNVILKTNPYNKNEFHNEISSTDKILIQIAGFREQKDQSTLIEALLYLPIDVKILLVGDGVLRKECEALVEQLQLEKRVLFLGLRMDVPQLLKTADIIVLSSKYEGLSLSSIEGMASGKPFVASDVPGLSDIVGGAGVLFECGNAKELATKILALLDNKTYYDSVVSACLEKAQQYDSQIMIQKHIALYKSVYEN